MKGHYDRTKQAESARLGCKYADQIYAGSWGITEEEAQKRYRCQTALSDNEMCDGKKSPECPFKEFSECLEESDLPKKWKQGYVAGALRQNTVHIYELPSSTGKVEYECECGGVLKIERRFMTFCYHCGARVK